MATTRDLINKVLRGIRQFSLIMESGVTATTDDYLLMILQFVNEAKEEIEEAGWPWQALRQTVTVTLAASTIEYDLTIAGAADVNTNDRSRLLYDMSNVYGSSEGFYNSAFAQPMVFDVTTSTEYRLKEVSQERIERWHFTDNDEQQQPTYFTLYTDGDSIRMKVYPTPDKTYTLKMRMFIPQAELTASDLTTVLSIPNRPVWTKALFKANQERGEELGKPGSVAEIAWLDAHGSATASEMSPADYTVNLER